MEMRVISALYAYPQLDRIGKDLEEHIKNKALLSYGSRVATEKLAESLALEIVKRQGVERLKAMIDKAIGVLSEEERTLLDIRYFGKADRVRRQIAAAKAGLCKLPFKPWKERTYYRKQAKLLKRMIALLRGQGLDERSFDDEYMEIDYVAMLYQYLALGKTVAADKKERQLLLFMSET